MSDNTLSLTQTNTALSHSATAPRRALLNVALLATPLIIAALVLWGMAARNSYNLDAPVLHTDFLATLAGARLIHDGNGTLLYDLDAQYAAQTRLTAPYFTASNTLVHNHPPSEALLVAPLADLPPWLLFVLWNLFCALAVGLSLCLLNATLPLFRGSRPIVVLVVLLALCSYQPLIRSFMLGQNSALVLLALSATYVAARRQHDTLTGLSLFMVALLKPQMLPIFLLLILLQHRWKALLVFAAAPIAFYLATMPILGAAWPLQYVRLLTVVADWQDLGVINPAIMHNWKGFSTTLFGSSLPALVTPTLILLTLASVGLVIWVWMRSHSNMPASAATPETNIHKHDLLWALAIIVAVLVSPHLNPHDLTLLLLPAWIILSQATRYLPNNRPSRIWLALLCTAYLLVPLTLFAGETTNAPWLTTLPNILLLALTCLLLAHRILLPPSERAANTLGPG